MALPQFGEVPDTLPDSEPFPYEPLPLKLPVQLPELAFSVSEDSDPDPGGLSVPLTVPLLEVFAEPVVVVFVGVAVNWPEKFP